MSRQTASLAKNASAPAVPAGFIAVEELGRSGRHARRLFDELAKLGAARRIGNARFVDGSHPAVKRRLRRVAADRSYEDLSGLTPKQIEGGNRWLRIIQAGRGEIAGYMARCGCNRMTAVEWFCRERCAELGFGMISVGTYRRREARYNRAGRDKLRSQIDTRGGRQDRVESCDPQAWQVFQSFYLDDRRRTVALCYELTAEVAARRGWAWPSLRTIQRRVIDDIPEDVRTLAREGERAYKSKCVPRAQRDRSVIPAGDRYCGDECTLDLYCRAQDGRGGWKRTRPILTAWLCERSRVFVGWHIADRANTDTILAAFKMGLHDYGTPRHVTIDNGHDYTCSAGVTKRTKRCAADRDRVAGVFADLEIIPHFAIPYNPQSKLLESSFRTVHERFDKLWESYCGGSPVTRPEGALDIPLHELPTIDQVRERFAAWLTAYHNRPHSAPDLFGYSPLQAWAQFQPAVRRERIDGARLDFLTCRYVGPRTVDKYGVRHRGVYYGLHSDQLAALQGRKVWLRIDPDRADFVWVCDFATKKPLLKAECNALAGATQADVRDAQRLKARRRRAVRAERETRCADIDTGIDAVIRAQVARVKSQRTQDQPPAGPPAAGLQLVRPDLAAAIDAASKGDRSGRERRHADNVLGDAFAILAERADEWAAGRGDEPDADGVDFADLADMELDPAQDAPDEDADGFAILADDLPEARRYGAAG